MPRSLRFLALVFALAVSALGAAEFVAPSLRATPDRADWKYAPVELVKFHVGPETLPTEEYRDWVP